MELWSGIRAAFFHPPFATTTPMSPTRVRSSLLCFPSAVALCGAALAAGGGTNGTTARVSLASGGGQVFSASRDASLSRDGLRVAFESDAALLPEDTNVHTDIYVRDLSTGALTLASKTILGLSANGPSRYPKLSGDGRYVVFESLASNALGIDGNGTWDVLLRDLSTGSLERISAQPGSVMAASHGGRRPYVSNDGRYVVFDTYSSEFSAADTNNYHDVYLMDRQLDTLQLVSVGMFAAGNAGSLSPVVSDNGRYVAFESEASNLVFNDTNDADDVFVRDRMLGTTSLVSRVPGGVIGNDKSVDASISADGRYVAFATFATNFKAGDLNGDLDVYVLDRTTNELRHASATPGGNFTASSGGSGPALSADGACASFTSAAPELIGGGPIHLAVYVRELESGVTRLASRASGFASLPNGASRRSSLNGDGTLVAFDSSATNLVGGDVNLQNDVFVRTLYADPIAYCTSSVTSAGCEPSLSATGLPRISQNAGFVVSCDDVPNNKLGLYMYGFEGRQAVPFGAGTFCLITPVTRAPSMHSGGSPGPVEDCSGSYQLDFNAFAKGLLGVAPHAFLGVVGQRVGVQCWGRDPQGAIATTFLSNALEYVVGP
jgi:Tol biopolymer transport system component